MRELWLGDRVDFEGEYFTTKGASIYDVPEGGIPVYIAAGGPVVARYAGRSGDGFICTSGKGMELYTEKLMPAVAEGAAKAGRDVAEIDKMIEIKISYDTDPELALENTRFWAPLSLTPEQKHSIDDPIEMEKAADALPIEQVAKRWIVASDPDEAVAQIRPYLDAGLNHLVFHAPGHDQKRFLELFERDLAPRLRGARMTRARRHRNPGVAETHRSPQASRRTAPAGTVRHRPDRGDRSRPSPPAISTSTTANIVSPVRRSACSSTSPGPPEWSDHREAMFAGDHINVSEDRAVLHTALRERRERTLIVDGQDVIGDVHAVLDRMGEFTDRDPVR